MGIIVLILLGLVAGWLASLLMGTNRTQGPLMDIALGIAGSLLGGFLMRLIGAPEGRGFGLYTLLVATLGAALLIGVGKVVRRA